MNLELSWTHYRHLLKVESAQARLWYMQEAVKENWSTRSLERQINSFYYDRFLASTDKAPVTREAKEKTHMLTPRDVLKDPYVLEFLQLKNRPHYTEGEQMFASKYQFVLPKVEELEAEIRKELDSLTGES